MSVSLTIWLKRVTWQIEHIRSTQAKYIYVQHNFDSSINWLTVHTEAEPQKAINFPKRWMYICNWDTDVIQHFCSKDEFYFKT